MKKITDLKIVRNDSGKVTHLEGLTKLRDHLLSSRRKTDSYVHGMMKTAESIVMSREDENEFMLAALLDRENYAKEDSKLEREKVRLEAVALQTEREEFQKQVEAFEAQKLKAEK